MNFEQIHQDWKTVRYPWLPTSEEISKSLGEHMPREELQKLEVTRISDYRITSLYFTRTQTDIHTQESHFVLDTFS
jgi:hypothetical protein